MVIVYYIDVEEDDYFVAEGVNYLLPHEKSRFYQCMNLPKKKLFVLPTY